MYKAFCELLSTHTVLNVLSHIIVILFLIVYSEDGLNILKGVFKKKVVYYLKKKRRKKESHTYWISQTLNPGDSKHDCTLFQTVFVLQIYQFKFFCAIFGLVLGICIVLYYYHHFLY